MVILAVDYGESRTGLAACDKGEMLASPVCVIAEKDEDRLIEKIIQKADEYGAQLIVVGCPRNMDGSFGQRAEKCISFAEKIKTAGEINTDLFDERLTTVAAHRALNEVNVRGKKRKNIVDAVAAVMILEDYLKARKSEK